MSPSTIITLINLAEQLALIIDQEVTAQNAAENQVAWTASQQFYLQGLAALKAKVATEQNSTPTS